MDIRSATIANPERAKNAHAVLKTAQDKTVAELKKQGLKVSQ